MYVRVSEILALTVLKLCLNEQSICIIFLSWYFSILFILPKDGRAFYHARTYSSSSSFDCFQCPFVAHPAGKNAKAVGWVFLLRTLGGFGL